MVASDRGRNTRGERDPMKWLRRGGLGGRTRLKYGSFLNNGWVKIKRRGLGIKGKLILMLFAAEHGMTGRVCTSAWESRENFALDSRGGVEC